MSSALKDAFRDYMNSHGGGEGVFPTPVEGLVLMRMNGERLPNHMIYRPALCVVAQGAKQILLGDRVFDYAEMQQVVVSVDIPAYGRVVKASPEEPFMALSLEFDRDVMRSVLEALDAPPQPSPGTDLAVFVDDVSDALADCVVRLVKLMSTPKAVPVLYPAIMREICFWLLTGPYGSEICKIAMPDSQTRRLTDAIYLLRDNFTTPLRIHQLAAAARMSPSSFHQHFKALTSMTPLQYQKQLRLLEARRLLLSGNATAADAAYQVGYESASQFSREYARMFGTPPKRSVTEMKATAA